MIKSPRFLCPTVVTPCRRRLAWWNGGFAGTRTRDQPRNLSGLLYGNRLCSNASASRGFFLCFISRSKPRASSSESISTAATTAKLSPIRLVECVWPRRCSRSRRSSSVVEPIQCCPESPRRMQAQAMRLSEQLGGLAGTRTRDQRLKRPLLYRLSYQPAGAREISPPHQPMQDFPAIRSAVFSFIFRRRALHCRHQNRHLRKILGCARLDPHAGTGHGALWRQHILR